MALETQPNEHAFVPRENTLTAVFAVSGDARQAIPLLEQEGIRADEVDLVTRDFHHAPDLTTPGIKQDTRGAEEAFDEIMHVVTESFSDDDKVFVQFDRVLASGGALLSLFMTGREDRRSDLATILRSHGASAVYYWGALATERL